MIRLLVVDDSPLVRRLLGELFRAAGDFEVAVARDGVEALEALVAFKPDVITLDVQMPRLDGISCLDRIMVERPTPVVMVSSLTGEGAAETVEALSLGAVDVVQKPGGAMSLEIGTFGPGLVETVRAAAGARIRRSHRLAERVRGLSGAAGPRTRPPRPRHPPVAAKGAAGGGEGLVLVGCSTGGPPALDALLQPLPGDFPWPIVVAQHMPRAFTGALARRLDALCELDVVEVVRPTPLQPGCVYIGRGDADVIVTRRSSGLFALGAPADPAYRWHPSADRLVDSAREVLPAANLAGVLMTGMGNDGAAAMTRLYAEGGWTAAEAEETAVVWGMPGELVRAGGARVVAPLEALADALLAAVAS
ncbi:chemotaxis-specific protein-glutamate methyltransferase CheB [Phenylobacterium sp. J426]|uniref:chemotaxis-specific protein-glutamate methyltransferase CheB n=1 Tax=Phenylobacterium sp. J426 TaxID=2898439 RepID=UPI0021507494|nr:chemotaxis-specific protein-glutamate methyltransferase CheB [Phenylobacterium sp. J426]MCR5874530.1 chemotaxis-specific protein-glutamate methyltransferase CheB [Phenylobacterium sp. J426]